MNWYYIRDRERVGPVGEAELKALFAEGAIPVSTLVWREGMEGWEAFSSVFPEERPPESRAEVPPVPAGPPSGPGGPSFPATGIWGDAAALAAVPCVVRVGDCFSRAWSLFTGSKFGLLLGAGVLAYVVYMGASNIPIVGVVAILFTWAIFAGLYQYYLEHIRGGDPPFERLFSGFTFQLGPLIVIALIQGAVFLVCFAPAVVAAVVGGIAEEEAILVLAGVLALVGFVPFVYLFVAWSFGPILCLDKGLGPWVALETSRKVVNRNWFGVFVLVVLTTLVSCAGLLLLCVGVLFTMPYASLVFTYLYHDTFDQADKEEAKV